jgi:hypothetical protein
MRTRLLPYTVLCLTDIGPTPSPCLMFPCSAAEVESYIERIVLGVKMYSSTNLPTSTTPLSVATVLVFNLTTLSVVQIPIHKEIKSRLKSGNACYHSVQNRLSSSLLSKNLKIKIYRTIILPVVLYGCETWSHKLRV